MNFRHQKILRSIRIQVLKRKKKGWGSKTHKKKKLRHTGTNCDFRLPLLIVFVDDGILLTDFFVVDAAVDDVPRELF